MKLKKINKKKIKPKNNVLTGTVMRRPTRTWSEDGGWRKSEDV
jgi:hypothetical protein